MSKKVYQVTTVEINLNTFETDTVTTIRQEGEMSLFSKPRKLYKTVISDSYTDGNRFFSISVTRIR